ncbi:MAG: hypothetical protein HC836_46760 [Richelia sp. RM2_1_2]|nr:hypothetical protein [Richelia sp. RM2_1_2]
MGVNAKHVFDVLIGESYQGTMADLDINSLTAGQLTIIEPNDRALAVDGAQVFQIAQADTEIGFRLSLPIYFKNIRNYRHQQYRAPRRQRVTFTFPTAVIGTAYTLHINPLSTKEVRTLRRTYQLIATETSAANNATTLVNAINNDANNKLVTAQVATAGITLEAKSDDIYFAIGLEDGLKGVTLTTVVTPFPGYGTFKQVRDLEIKGKAYKGHLNRVKYVDPVNYYSNNTPVTVALTAPATVSVTNGSPTVTDAGANSFLTSQTNLGRALVVGDVINITSVTAGKYRIVAIAADGSTITLDRPFEETTEVALAIAGITVETLYDLYFIEHDQQMLGIDENFRPHVTTVVAIKQLGTSAANFKTLLDSLVA